MTAVTLMKSSSPGRGQRVGVTGLRIGNSRIARVQPSDVDQLAADFDRSRCRADVVVHHGADVSVLRLQGESFRHPP